MALRHLGLRDFVIVRTLELELDDGFTALTGETGAGKSILVDALQLALGGRGDSLWVMEGCDECEISAEFDTPPALQPWLQEAGFDSGDDTVLLRRVIAANGRSRAWINGGRATMEQLRRAGEQLVDIHGQHAWQGLTRPAEVRALYDAFAGVDRAALDSAWRAWQDALANLAAARQQQAERNDERDRLAWQLDQLEQLAPGEGEWESLTQAHTRLAHAQQLAQAAQQAEAALEGDERGHSAAGALARAQTALSEHEHLEPEFGPLLQMLADCEAQVQDAAHTLRSYGHRVEQDPQQLDELDARMGTWHGMAQRLHRPPKELPALMQQWRQQLAQLEAAADLGRLQHDVELAEAAFMAVAGQASAQRRAASAKLAQQVNAGLARLGMAGNRFQVQLQALDAPAAWGLESCSFQIAAHEGASAHDIGRVASGGELSRLALVIAVATSALRAPPTLVFDEVDAGIGGAVAATVGQMLRTLGQQRQVLCVTHLPQVASCARQHLGVNKHAGADGPTSTVEPLVGTQRVREIARMLSGSKMSDATLLHATEMLAEHGAEHP